MTARDTFVRYNLPIITVIGNDAGWIQIARDQMAILHDDVATELKYNDYHIIANGWMQKSFYWSVILISTLCSTKRNRHVKKEVLF